MGMLVLTRKQGEWLNIGDHLKVLVRNVDWYNGNGLVDLEVRQVFDERLRTGRRLLKAGETLDIGGGVSVFVKRIQTGRVSLGVEAPLEMRVSRGQP